MVSIIIPTYNASAYIGRCIESILNMDYDDYEVIIVNDGSTDATLDILRRYEEMDRRIKVINKENGGSASARNVGLKAAEGAFIAFVDADDYVDRLYLSILTDVQRKYDADIVECGFYTVKSEKILSVVTKENVEVLTNVQKLEEFCTKKSYLKTAVLWNKLYKKSLYTGMQFPEGKGIDDEFLIHRIIWRARKIVTTQEVLYYYFLSENSQMRSKVSLKTLDVIEAIEDQMALFRQIDNVHLYNMLLYRYYRSVIGGYYLVKTHFPEEREKLTELKKKKRNYYQALIVSETLFSDKIFLIMNCYFPGIAKQLHKRFAGENEISKKTK